jgi:CDP-diacylglycerol--glycerol-3-phosphate 3-phosphatidyltransferase
LLVVVTATAAAYGVRLIARGVARSERVARIGGSVLVGREVMDCIYWAIEPIVRALAALGVTPNMLTWAALVFGIGAGVALGFGGFGLACLLSTVSTLCDVLDGQVARLTGTGSDRGELLDAAVDRYTEFAFLAGLAVFVRANVAQLALTIAAIQASFMVSYASAKAEALRLSLPRGLMRRHERGAYLIVGAGLTALIGSGLTLRYAALPPCSFELAAVAIVAVVGNAAAVLRFARIVRARCESSPDVGRRVQRAPISRRD